MRFPFAPLAAFAMVLAFYTLAVFLTVLAAVAALRVMGVRVP